MARRRRFCVGLTEEAHALLVRLKALRTARGEEPPPRTWGWTLELTASEIIRQAAQSEGLRDPAGAGQHPPRGH